VSAGHSRQVIERAAEQRRRLLRRGQWAEAGRACAQRADGGEETTSR